MDKLFIYSLIMAARHKSQMAPYPSTPTRRHAIMLAKITLDLIFSCEGQKEIIILCWKEEGWNWPTTEGGVVVMLMLPSICTPTQRGRGRPWNPTLKCGGYGFYTVWSDRSVSCLMYPTSGIMWSVSNMRFLGYTIINKVCCAAAECVNWWKHNASLI